MQILLSLWTAASKWYNKEVLMIGLRKESLAERYEQSGRSNVSL